MENAESYQGNHNEGYMTMPERLCACGLKFPNDFSLNEHIYRRGHSPADRTPSEPKVKPQKTWLLPQEYPLGTVCRDAEATPKPVAAAEPPSMWIWRCIKCRMCVQTQQDLHINQRPICVQCNAEMEPANAPGAHSAKEEKQ